MNGLNFVRHRRCASESHVVFGTGFHDSFPYLWFGPVKNAAHNEF